jgi:hypothetical protein
MPLAGGACVCLPVQLNLPLCHLLIVAEGVEDGRLDGREGSNRVTATPNTTTRGTIHNTCSATDL